MFLHRTFQLQTKAQKFVRRWNLHTEMTSMTLVQSLKGIIQDLFEQMAHEDGVLSLQVLASARISRFMWEIDQKIPSDAFSQAWETLPMLNAQ